MTLCISTFDEIQITNNMLILCDIDDTVFCYGEQIKKYWESKIHDPGYQIWHSIIERISPKLTDKNIHKFINNALQMNCKIHFVTHRNKLFTDITHKHLEENNLHHIPVHFLSGCSKGDYINQNFDLSLYHKIVFIDDSEYNIIDVKNKVNNSINYKFLKK